MQATPTDSHHRLTDVKDPEWKNEPSPSPPQDSMCEHAQPSGTFAGGWRTGRPRAGPPAGAMVLLCALLLPPLLQVAPLSGPGECQIHRSGVSQRASPLMESLQCHNDYESRVLCKWRKRRNQTLQLWFLSNDGSQRCLPSDAGGAAEDAVDRCVFETDVLAIGINHTVIFKTEAPGLCSAARETLSLPLHLKALPPVNLSSRDAGDGARRLGWSGPYPTSPNLNSNLTYQLRYRAQGHHSWTTKDVKNTSVTLEGSALLPGCRYEAGVRARASVSQWSVWGPAVTWHTPGDFVQVPALHCVLRGEKDVMCSWEVRGEPAHSMSYHLACQRKHAAPPEGCCMNLTVRFDGPTARYSCRLDDPEPQRLRLVPTHNAKTFEVHKHVRPKPPRHVKVREEGNNWVVEWEKPSKASELSLAYQVCYSRKRQQGSSVLLNVSAGSTSVTILGSSLTPSQEYKVTVRSFIDPAAESSCTGIPSEWTHPVDWTSREESWSNTIEFQVFVSLLLVAIFFTLFCTIPACQRKLHLWLDSVPSPSKSKIMSDLKSATSRSLTQGGKNASICKTQHLESLSAGSCSVSLWPTKDGEKKGQDEGCRNCNNQPPSAEEANSCGTSSRSFDGPYIVFESPHQVLRSTKVTSEDEHTPSPSPLNFTLYGEGYVWLPSRVISMSTQDLASRSNDRMNPSSRRSDEEASIPHTGGQSAFSEHVNTGQQPQHTTEPFMPWPQGGTVQPSGYCHLPPTLVTPAD